jgi:glutaminyl-tRNA synthetase
MNSIALCADSMPASMQNSIKFGVSDSLKTITAYVVPAMAQDKAADKFQFAQHKYFVTDRVDHKDGNSLFNRATRLKDSWGK